MLAEPRVPVSDRAWFQKVVHAAFHERRKMLPNSLRASGLFPEADIEAVLKACSIDAQRRAETLSLKEFSDLAIHLPRPVNGVSKE